MGTQKETTYCSTAGENLLVMDDRVARVMKDYSGSILF